MKNVTEKKLEVTAGLTTDGSFYESLAAVRGELEALPAESLLRVNLDVHAAVVTALGCLPELRTHREALAAQFGDAFAKKLDALETYAKAAEQAHGEFLASQTSSTELAALSKELVETREILATDATSLVNRKRLDPGVLSGLRGTVGFRNQVLDVVQLTAIFRRHWESVRDVTPVTLADLERAERLATRVANVAGLREQGDPETTSVGERRQRAFTLFVRTYDQLRRAMTFLRWDEGDVDTVVPSLWAGRGGRGKRTDVTREEPKTDEPTEPVVATPVPNNGGPAFVEEP